MASEYEDDGDFDWEAAVAEIDKACDKSQQSKATNKYCQKTFDAFLKLSQPRPLVQESIHIDGGEGGKGKEIVADSDPSAFTTWVYPANIPCREYQLPRQHYLPTPLWLCQLVLAKPSLLLLSCTTTSDGFQRERLSSQHHQGLWWCNRLKLAIMSWESLRNLQST